MRWVYKAAEEYCESVRDGTHDTPKQTEFGYRLVTGKHIKNGQIDPSDAYYISEKDYTKINERSLVEQWDVLMSMIGTVGEVAVVQDVPNYAIKNVALFKCGGSEVRGKWLAYYLRSSEAQGHMMGHQKGSSQQFLSLKQLRSLPIPVTNVEYMQKVVDILSVYDDLIENNQKQIKLLEEAAQRLYKEWFVDLRFPGYENTPIIDGVPQGWRKELVGNVIEKSYRSKQVMTADYLEEGKIPVIDQSRDFIAGYTDDEETVVSLGKPVIVFGDHTRILKYIQFPFAKGADGTQLIISKCENMTQPLLYLSLLEIDLSNYHYARHFKYLKAEEIIVPDIITAKHFEKLVQPIFAKVQILRDQINNAKQARDRLLPKLMSGELEV